MQLPFRAACDDRDYLEPGPSRLLPLSCVLAMIVGVVVLGAELGERLALIAAGSAVVSIATRLPRILPITALLCLAVAAIAVLVGPASAAGVAHALTHSTAGN